MSRTANRANADRSSSGDHTRRSASGTLAGPNFFFRGFGRKLLKRLDSGAHFPPFSAFFASFPHIFPQKTRKDPTFCAGVRRVSLLRRAERQKLIRREVV